MVMDSWYFNSMQRCSAKKSKAKESPPCLIGKLMLQSCKRSKKGEAKANPIATNILNTSKECSPHQGVGQIIKSSSSVKNTIYIYIILYIGTCPPTVTAGKWTVN